ncbi:MAG: GatB/YqeY domain-containing protein [Polyangiaceae bacterium]
MKRCRAVDARGRQGNGDGHTTAAPQPRLEASARCQGDGSSKCPLDFNGKWPLLDPALPEIQGIHQSQGKRMLLDEIKAQMFKAMKEGRVVEKEILRVAVGEITTNAARPGQSGSDDEVRAIVRKLIKSNEESLAVDTDPSRRATLELERKTLAAFLPQTLDVEAIVQALAPVSAAIGAAGNEGQATGVAMKHLKSIGAAVTGKDVATAVKQIRG